MSIPEQRLRNQLITRPGPRRPENVVAWFGAMQAQEYGPAKWALGLRSPGITDAAVERAVARGRILRTHVLRPTWHFVTPADIRWMLELTAPEVHRRMAAYNRQLGLDLKVTTRAVAVIERALGDYGLLTRAELGLELDRAGLPGKRTELAHIMMFAELEGVICSGPRRGSRFTYALLADRAPAARRLPRDEALAELTRRYLRSHGPATVRDYVWWSGLRTSDAKRGIEIAGARDRQVDGHRYWSLTRTGRDPEPTEGVHLLPVYDEYLVAYRDHRAVPRAAYTFGGVLHALVIRGQVAGTWKSRADRAGISLDLAPQRKLSSDERRGLASAVERYGGFLGVPAKITPRTKPLSRA